MINCDQMNNPRVEIERSKFIKLYTKATAFKNEGFPHIKAAQTTKREMEATKNRVFLR